MLKGYDFAQICLNGHVINDSTFEHPQLNLKHCFKCGCDTIIKCPDCNSGIHGHYYDPGYPGFSSSGKNLDKAPSFCHDCGKPYPWTKSAIKAAQELAERIVILSQEEKETLKECIDDLVKIKDTPQERIVVSKFKMIAQKAGQEIYNGFKDVLTNLLSEVEKKSL